MKRRILPLLIATMMGGSGFVACTTSNQKWNSPASNRSATTPSSSCQGQTDLAVVSGSENETMEQFVEAFNDANDGCVVMKYEGSVDISRILSQGAEGYDAVWPASSLWIEWGDRQSLVTHTQSILRSPVVFAVKQSLAEELGLMGKTTLSMDEILAILQNPQVQFAMTSPTQSNSGNAFYIGALYAFAGNPPVLTEDDLHNPQLAEKISEVLGSVDRTSGSSGWLKDLMQSNEQLNAWVNYEALVIELNQELVRQGKEPFIVFYPPVPMADSPLGFVDHGDSEKEALFQEFQDYLLSEPVQQDLLALGRRTGELGITLEPGNQEVFNPAWGIDPQVVISPIKLPTDDVIDRALNLAQSAFRKPSLTVFVLDYSGSMMGGKEQELEAAIALRLDTALAEEYLLQASPDDIHVVIPYDSDLRQTRIVRDGGAASLETLFQQVRQQSAKGGTDTYGALLQAYEYLEAHPEDMQGRHVAIVLMSDGNANGNITSAAAFHRIVNQPENVERFAIARNIPIFTISFGADADQADLTKLANDFHGRHFHADEANLFPAFQDVLGYN